MDLPKEWEKPEDSRLERLALFQGGLDFYF
jgi:hypothetical protein